MLKLIKQTAKRAVTALLVLSLLAALGPAGLAASAAGSVTAADDALAAYADEAPAGKDVVFRSTVQDGLIVLSLINGSLEEVSGLFILAIYKDGRLAHTEIGDDFVAKAGGIGTYEYTVDATEYPDSAYAYKAFCWEADCVPLAPAVSVNWAPDDVSAVSLNWETYPLVVGGRTPASMLDNGDFFDLEATIDASLAPGAKVVWASTDPEIVKVSQTGRIKAVRTGFANVVAALANGDAAVCQVSCIDNYDRATVRYVTLNADFLQLAPGASADLTPTLYPVNAYNLNAGFSAVQNTQTWTSSDENVAAVNQTGTVTAVAPGEAVITVVSDQIVARTAQCRVIVGESGASGISLDQSSLALQWGEAARLTAEVAGVSERSVSWSTSNAAVADVDDTGKVTAYASGTATITATSIDGGFKADCAVTVTGVPVEPISVNLNRARLSLPVDSTSSLTAVVVPANTTFQTITWSSSNPDVVKVEEAPDTTIFNAPVGNLTAVGPGTAVITARCGSVAATCPITVTAGVVDAAQVALDKTALSLEVDAVVTLSATVTPEDTTDPSLFWVSTDTHVASVSLDGIVKAYAPGTTEIIAVPKRFVVGDPLTPSLLDAQEIADSDVFSAKLAEIIDRYPTASCIVTVSAPAGSAYLRNIVAPAEATTPRSVGLLWNRSSLLYAAEFDAYRVYVNGELRDTVGTLGYTVKGLAPGTAYTFTVEAVKTNGEVARAQSIDVTTKPDYTAVLDVTKAPYNAVGNGKVTDTYAIQRAVNDCPKDGMVYLPEGYVFWSGALFLKSDMTFKVDGILIGSIEGKDYPKMNTRWEGWRKVDKGYVVDNTANPKQPNERAHASLITVGAYDEGDNSAYGPFNVSNVVVCGKGQINANGLRLSYTELDRNNTRTNSSRVRGRAFTSHNVQGLYVADVGIAWSPSWITHLIYSDKVTFDHCLVIGSGTGLVTSGKSRPSQLVPELVSEYGTAGNSGSRSCIINGDGIDPDSSRNFNVFRCLFSAGDDAMAMKSGRNGQGFDLHKPLAYIRVTDCHVQNSDGGLAIGSENAGGAHDILFQNLTMKNVSLHGLWIKSMWARGGLFENIDFKDAWMTGIDANVILMEYRYSSSTSVPARTVPVMRRLLFENCHGYGTNGRGFGFRGTPLPSGFDATTGLGTETTILREDSRVTETVVRPLGYVQDVIMKGCSLTGRVTNTSASNQACIHVADNFDIYDTDVSALAGTSNTNRVVWTYGTAAEAAVTTRIRFHDECPDEFVRLQEKGKTREEMYPYYLSEDVHPYYKSYNSFNTLYPLYPY
ncbi:MAG: Ig-like domain-containing protein [Oscillospiraceae bacterium]|nr:Ig-like domain-containing protein [Oscillospiraceae bacterium]